MIAIFNLVLEDLNEKNTLRFEMVQKLLIFLVEFASIFVRKMHGQQWRLWSICNSSIAGSKWILSELKLSYVW